MKSLTNEEVYLLHSEIDRILSIRDEHNFCDVCKKFKYSEVIFQIRAEKIFPYKVIILKKDDITWEYFYITVTESICINSLLELRILMEYYNYIPDIIDASVAAEKGQLDVVKYLASIDVLPSEHGVNMALKNNHINVIEFLASKNIFPILK